MKISYLLLYLILVNVLFLSMNYFKLNHGSYPGFTYVYLNASPDEVISHYNKHKLKGYLLDEDGQNYLKEKTFGGLTLSSDCISLIYIPKFKNTSYYYGILNHELLHSVLDSMEAYGVRYENSNNAEPLTYQLGYLTEQLFKELFKLNIK